MRYTKKIYIFCTKYTKCTITIRRRQPSQKHSLQRVVEWEEENHTVCSVHSIFSLHGTQPRAHSPSFRVTVLTIRIICTERVKTYCTPLLWCGRGAAHAVLTIWASWKNIYIPSRILQYRVATQFFHPTLPSHFSP